MNSDAIFLDLGRLDERLKTSPARLSWHLKMRARGIAFAATNAGIPVDPTEVEHWLAGASLPPRHREGINDGLSIVSVAYFSLAALDAATDEPNNEAKRSLCAMFNRHAAVRDWASAERDELFPLFEQISDQFDNARPGRSLNAVARACLQLLSAAGSYQNTSKRDDACSDSCILHRDPPRAWLASVFVPVLLFRAAFLSSAWPSLIPSLRFVNMTADAIEGMLRQRLADEARYGLRELDRLEEHLENCLYKLRPTKRSHASNAAELLISFPSLQRSRLANCLGITPQGAGQLKRRISALR